MAKEAVGFIGLGIMGAPMAGHILRGGHALAIYNRTRAKMKPLVDLGASPCSSPRQVAECSTVVISVVSDSPDVEQVYLDENGVLAGARPGPLLMDMSTISPIMVARVAKAAIEKGCPMLDAPVSGGDIGAQKGILSIMVGGDPDAFERARPILELMGKPVLCGPSGSGQVVKACNQIATALHCIAMAEALVLGGKAGIDPSIVVQVLSGGYAHSRILELRGPRVVQEDFAPGFRSRLHYKDLNIVRETARAYGCALPAAALAHELFGAMQAQGWGDLDNSAVIKVLQLLSNAGGQHQAGTKAGGQ